MRENADQKNSKYGHFPRSVNAEKSTGSLNIMSSEANDPNSYTLKRIHCEKKSSPDLRRIVSTVIGTCEFSFMF